jgi:ABC-type branched-subunit amino acid transport system permease subunit
VTGVLNPEFWFFVAVIAGVYSLFSLGIQLQFGYAGLLNFGAVAYMLVAAYTMAILVVKVGVGLWLAMLGGLIASVLLGFLIALPTLRLRAMYLGFATIAVGEILRYLAIDLSGLTGGAVGSIGLLGPTSVASYNTEWYGLVDQIDVWLKPVLGPLATRDFATALIVWVLVAIAVGLLYALVRSPWGRALKAIREDEEVAGAMGKNVFMYKLQAFVIGGLLGGLAGLILAMELNAFAPADFTPMVTFYGFVIVLLAGTARMRAVPLGAILFAVLFAGTRFFTFWPFDLINDTDRQYLRLMIIGVILIATMLFRPQGMFGNKEELVL